MSRSTKQASPEKVSWLTPDPSDQPGIEKAGCRDRPAMRPRSVQQGSAMHQRRSYGSTEKILRRNRKTFTRLFAKIGRRLDREAVQESQEQ